MPAPRSRPAPRPPSAPRPGTEEAADMTTAPIGTAPGLDRLATFEGGTDAAGTDRIFADEGRRVARRDTPQYQQALGEVMRMYERVLTGNRRAAIDFQESLSRSDFSYLFADIIDRQLLAA